MTGTGSSVSETSYALLCQRLRRVLVDAVQARPGAAGGIGSVPCLASATLYALLMAHPVDRRGKCRLCRGPGWLGRRRRVCLVFVKAHYWLRQPPGQLAAQLARELGIDLLPPPYAADPQITQVQAGITIDPSRTPAVPRPLPPLRFPEAGWPDPVHGGTGEPSPDSPQSRRGPSAHSLPGPGLAVLLTGGLTWPS